MHLNAKKMAVSGLMLALTEACILAGSVLETNTLFLLAAASYFVGIVKREFGSRVAAAFYLAGVLFGFIVSPTKMYALTYAAMGLYILLIEIAWEWMGRTVTEETAGKYGKLFWAVKYAVFNGLYIPAVLLLQEFLFGRRLGALVLAAVLLAGQVGLFFYDYAYGYVQRELWGKLRGRFLD